jgi:CDP-diglyceride synthetase
MDLKTTTNFTIEYLIGGALFLFIILFFALSTFNLDIETLSKISEKNQFLVLLVFVAVAYPLGIFLDEFADGILERKQRSIKHKAGVDKRYPTTLGLMIHIDNRRLVSHFDSMRTKIRVARVIFLNSIFLTLVFLFLHYFNYTVYSVLSIIISYECWKRFNFNYYKFLKRTSEENNLVKPA